MADSKESAHLASAPRFFDSLAAQWSSNYQWNPAYRERLRVFISLIPAKVAESKGNILDLGCGSGDISLPLAVAGCHVVGVDASPAMLAEAKKLAEASAPGRAHFLLSDVCRVPCAAQSFDLVIASSVVEYVESHAAFFGEMRRLLRPGGVAVFSAPNPHSLYRAAESTLMRLVRFVFRSGRPPRALHGLDYLRFQRPCLSQEEWLTEVRAAGFEVEGVRCFGSPRPVYWTGSRIAAVLTASPRWGTLFACLLRTR